MPYVLLNFLFEFLKILGISASSFIYFQGFLINWSVHKKVPFFIERREDQEETISTAESKNDSGRSATTTTVSAQKLCPLIPPGLHGPIKATTQLNEVSA